MLKSQICAFYPCDKIGNSAWIKNNSTFGFTLDKLFIDDYKKQRDNEQVIIIFAYPDWRHHSY